MADPVFQGGAVLTGEISPRRVNKKKQPHPLNLTHLDRSLRDHACQTSKPWLGKAQSIPIDVSSQAKSRE